jgi:AcrR family transcriptional regulator
VAGLREAQKEMAQRLLLDSALELFEAKGYAATTVDDIAAAADTTRVTFYAYFPSRSDLMRALIGEANAILDRIATPEHGSTESALVAAAREGSRAAIEAFLRDRAAHWDQIRPYTRAAFEAATVDPELQKLVDDWVEEIAGDIETGLTEAGRFEPATRELRGRLAFVQLDYVARQWSQGRSRAEVDEMLDVLVDSWLNLLSDPGARAAD